MNLSKIKSIHMVGIKGIGMIALACIAQDYGMNISGSDLASPFIGDHIIDKRRWKLMFGFSSQHIKQPDLVVYSAGHNGVNNIEVQTALNKNIPIMTQVELLSYFTRVKPTIAVAGVGGKSTTSAMLSYLLLKAKLHPSYFVGVAQINKSIDPGKYDSTGKWFVVEADEYFDPKRNQPKFMVFSPKVVILPNLAYDHPDVYPDPQKTMAYFRQLINKIPKTGLLIANIDSPMVRKLIRSWRGPSQTYGFSQSGDWQIKLNQGQKDLTSFKLVDRADHQVYSFSLQVSGKHHLLNATGAILAAKFIGLSHPTINQSIKQFTGTKRRFEMIYDSSDYKLIDDYAHHPTQIKFLLEAVREQYQGSKIVIVFQPHTYSRTKALLSDFINSLSLADLILVTSIFASAREKVDPHINGKILVKKLKQAKVQAYFAAGEKEVVDLLAAKINPPAVILTVGAGNIFHWHPAIIKTIKQKLADS